MLHRCYRNRCTLVTENDASLLPILMYSILPKMMYFSLPITPVREGCDARSNQRAGGYQDMDCFCIHTSFSLKVDKKRTYEYGKGRKTPEKRVSVLAYLFENK